MKLISIIICLFLLVACSPMNSNDVVLKDSDTGKDLKNSCSSDDKNKEIYPAIQGKCDYIKKPSPFHHVTRQVIKGEVCCVREIYIDHDKGRITSFGK